MSTLKDLEYIISMTDLALKSSNPYESKAVLRDIHKNLKALKAKLTLRPVPMIDRLQDIVSRYNWRVVSLRWKDKSTVSLILEIKSGEYVVYEAGIADRESMSETEEDLVNLLLKRIEQAHENSLLVPRSG